MVGLSLAGGRDDMIFCVPEVSSGYLKDSALPKIADICHSVQAFSAKISRNINEISDKHLKQFQSIRLFRAVSEVSAI